MPVINVCDVDHGGTTRRVNVPAGTTIQGYIDRKKPNFTPDNYNVRVNENKVANFNQELGEGDRLTFARSKLAGA
tara:strand:+ start:24148 stop:24372 length:225 start_codon:yes stop_codon:yes gene_type:complete